MTLSWRLISIYSDFRSDLFLKKFQAIPKASQSNSEPKEQVEADPENIDFEIEDVPENKIEKITDSILR